MNNKKTGKYGLGLLLILGLLAGSVATARAAGEVVKSSISFSDTVTASQYVRITGDLTVSWTKPTGVDVMAYYIAINTASTPLSDTELNDATHDFAVEDPLDYVTIPNSFFNGYDSNQIHYLHIKTQYVPGSFSSDVVSEPIRIDNVAPGGTITITDPSTGAGSSTQITLSISPSEPITFYWLSESANFPGGDGTSGIFTSATWNIQATSYGSVPIYVWFQDYAGNRSSNPSASVTYTYQAPVSIQYEAPNNQMSVDSTLIFSLAGETLYNWTITPETGVAAFTTTSTGVASVTVEATAAGTFTVSATTTDGQTTLTTPTITAVQTSTSKIYNLITTSTTSVNAIVLSRAGMGYTKASDLYSAVSNCNDLSRWNAALQAYESYIPFANDFDLIVGEPYFVSVSTAGQFTATGSTPDMSFTLRTTATTSVNAISLPQSKSSLTKASELFADIPNANDLSRWNATLQAYESFIPFANDFNLTVDEAYFVSVSSQTTWP